MHEADLPTPKSKESLIHTQSNIIEYTLTHTNIHILLY